MKKAIIIGIVLILGINVSAQTYNPAKAAAYAQRWCNDKNTRDYNYYPLFPNGTGGDCANFVSQCLIEGGLDLSAGNPNADPSIFVNNGVECNRGGKYVDSTSLQCACAS